MSLTIKLIRESDNKCCAYKVENGQEIKILREGESPLFSDLITSYTVSKNPSGIGCVFETKWQQIAGFPPLPLSEREWLREGSTRSFP